MATDTGSTTSTEDSTTGTSTEEPSKQEPGQQQDTTSETEGQDQQQEPVKKDEKPIKLPDDHPLVKTLATQKDLIATQKTELADLRAKSAKVTKLEEDLAKRPEPEVVETLQKRYDRLEAFLQGIGGPISKALDSKTFTTELFESEKDIKDIIKDYAKANPSATSSALGAGGAKPAEGKVDPNVLLRAAAGK